MQSARWRSRLLLLFLRFTLTLATNKNGCDAPLGMEDGSIKDDQITAKTWLYFERRDSRYYRPHFARLNYRKPSGGWCSEDLDKFPEQFVQVDLHRNTKITGIATQGRHEGQEWVENFKIEYRRYNETRYRRYMEDGKWKILTANADINTTVKHSFKRPLIVQSLRVIPVGNRFTIHCMRFEIFGCSWNHAKDGLVSYSAPLGEIRKGLSLRDDTYDGYIPFEASEFVFGGIGKLTDGNIASEGPKFDPELKAYTQWVGYKKNPIIFFAFNDTRRFSSISFYVLNGNTNSLLFEKMGVEMSADGMKYKHIGSYFPNREAKERQGVLQIKVPLNGNVGMYLRCSFDLNGSWLLLTEIEFNTESYEMQPTIVVESSNSQQTKSIEIPLTEEPRKKLGKKKPGVKIKNVERERMLETDTEDTSNNIGLSFPIILTIVLVGIVIVFAFISFVARLIYSTRKAKKKQARAAKQSRNSVNSSEEETIGLNHPTQICHPVDT